MTSRRARGGEKERTREHVARIQGASNSCSSPRGGASFALGFTVLPFLPDICLTGYDPIGQAVFLNIWKERFLWDDDFATKRLSIV